MKEGPQLLCGYELSASSSFTGCLERRRPLERLSIITLGGSLELRESLVHIAALKMRHQGRNRYMDGRANRSELNLYRGFPELLHTARASDAALTHGTSVPLVKSQRVGHAR
jgi:hypothetical protein